MYNDIFIFNMYLGFWCSNNEYKREDIVCIKDSIDYYICIQDHTSDNLTYPCKEDIYWIMISSVFLNDLILVSSIKNTSEKNEDELRTKKRLTINTNPVSVKEPLQIIKIKKKCKRSLSDEEDYIESESNSLKRKLRCIEQELENHKRKKCGGSGVESLRDKLLLMNIDLDTKSFIVEKYDSTQKLTGSDHSKSMNWLRTVSKIPYGKYKTLPVSKTDTQEAIKNFFNNVKQKLDKNIYGLEDVKQEILEFVAKKISNPNSRGHVLALYGHPGVGKSKIIRSLADALELPFNQINFGGLNDASVLTGHSETYVGSKPGKIVEMFTNSQYMNPIIYLDEIDKISESKSAEIFGILTHLLDEEQNSAFQDNYLSNLNIDLSKVFFVLAFNDITKVDKIVSDRMKIIYINPPTLNEKLIICQDKLIPEILSNVTLKNNIDILIDKEVIEYVIVNKTQKESGVRQLRKNIEKIVNRLNYDTLIGNFENLKTETQFDKQVIIVTRTYVDHVLKSQDDNTSYLNMYL
jgi:ATP-dependent Lon protease